MAPRYPRRESEDGNEDSASSLSYPVARLIRIVRFIDVSTQFPFNGRLNACHNTPSAHRLPAGAGDAGNSCIKYWAGLCRVIEVLGLRYVCGGAVTGRIEKVALE